MYTVVIFDVLHKVIELSRIYENEIAEDIITNIDNMRKEKPYSSKWEEYLIYRVTKKFHGKEGKFKSISVSDDLKSLQLFDEFGLIKMQNLKSDRNLCAHPTNDANRELRVFNQEDARLHIRNMFEYVFLKDSFYIADFINLLDSDILKYYKIYDVNLEGCVKNNNIESYFENSYFKDSDEVQKEFIIKYLIENIIEENNYKKGKMIFKLLDMIIDKNIELSTHVFTEGDFIGSILNQISFSDEEFYYPTRLNNAFSRVVMIFFKYPKLFFVLNDKLKDKIRIECGKGFKYYILADFLDNDLGEHLKNTEDIRRQNSRINPVSVNYDSDLILCLYSKYKGNNVFNEFLLNTILNSDSYVQSEGILENLLPVIINDFTKDQCITLMSLFNSNSQYYGLGGDNKYNSNHKDLRCYLSPLKEIIFNKLGEDFDYSKFENLKCF